MLWPFQNCVLPRKRSSESVRSPASLFKTARTLELHIFKGAKPFSGAVGPARQQLAARVFPEPRKMIPRNFFAELKRWRRSGGPDRRPSLVMDAISAVIDRRDRVFATVAAPRAGWLTAVCSEMPAISPGSLSPRGNRCGSLTEELSLVPIRWLPSRMVGERVEIAASGGRSGDSRAGSRLFAREREVEAIGSRLSRLERERFSSGGGDCGQERSILQEIAGVSGREAANGRGKRGIWSRFPRNGSGGRHPRRGFSHFSGPFCALNHP